MKQIRIIRNSSGNVIFETVSIDNTENVFFINLDPLAEHWPAIADNKLGPAPSPPSSQCIPQATYGCKIAGHGNERGSINIVDPLAAVNTTLASTVHGQPITLQRVVQGGIAPYQISGELFEIVGPGGIVIQSGSGIGPGLRLTADNTGIFVRGTPTVVGTYQFTFVVNDAMGSNLQQIQYSMVVT